MPDKKLTDNEIVKALECCNNCDCADCPLIDKQCNPIGDALDLINRLQAENKRLTTLAELGNKRANDYRVMRDRALKAEAEVERLKNAYKQCAWERDYFEADKKRLYEIIENKI